MNKEDRITYEEFMLMFKNAPRLAYMLYDKAEDEISILNNIIKQKDNIINELEKWLKEPEYFNGRKLRRDYITVLVDDVLDKLKELKGDDNEK